MVSTKIEAMDNALSIPEAALKLGVSADTVRRRVKSGQIKAVREQHGRNHQWLIDLSEDEQRAGRAAGVEPVSGRERAGATVTINRPPADTLANLQAQVNDLRASLEMAKSELEARRGEVARLLALLERDSPR